MNGTYQSPILLGSSTQGGILSGNLDVGLAYVAIVLSGTVKDDGTTRDLKFSDLGKIDLTIDGNNVMSFENGYMLKQYLQFNGFITANAKANAPLQYLVLPMFRNVKTLAQQALTYLETGGQNNLSLTVEILGNSAADNSVLTDGQVYYQPITVANSPNGKPARLSISSHIVDIPNLGQHDVINLPKVGALWQLMFFPPAGADASAEAPTVSELEVWANNSVISTIRPSQQGDEIETSDHRRSPTFQFTGGKIDQKNIIGFDPSLDGQGSNLAGEIQALNLSNLASFRPRLNVLDKGEAGKQNLVAIMATIVGLG